MIDIILKTIALLISVFIIGAFTTHPVKTEAPVIIDTVDHWALFTQALIDVESGGNDTIVGEHHDGGCLQITPIAIKEANRILGREEYTLSDRFNRARSIEVFNVIQGFYNPDHDLHFALKIHNPRASINYHKKVIEAYIRSLR